MAKCKNCKHMIYQKVVFNYTTTEYPYCPAIEECLDDIDKEIVCSGFEGITNADRIRSMTDEELAEFFLKVNTAYAEPCMTGESDCVWEDYPTHDKGCKDCFLEWLKSEVGCE